MENLKRSAKRLLTRLTILGLVVICGAIAIAQVQKQNATANAADGLTQPSKEFVEDTAASLQQPMINALSAREDPVPNVDRWANDNIQPVKAVAERFIDDSRVVATQAVEAVSNNFDQFDEPFPRSNAAPVEPPKFNDPPSFNDAPPFIGSDTPAPPREGAMADADARQFTDNFPPAGFPGDEAPAPGAGAMEQPQTEPPRFGHEFDVAEVPDPSATRSGNPMRSGAAVEQPGSRFGVAQAETSQPPAIEPRTDFGSVQRQDDAFGAAPSFSSHDNSFVQAELPPPNNGGIDRLNQNSVSLSGEGVPGPREMEGPQSASITIQKKAPQQVRVGEPAKFEVTVRNNGSVAAEHVLIRDQVPKGTQLVDTTPAAKSSSSGGIYWEIGTLPPNQDVTVSMQVTPLAEGPIGSVATVSFDAMATARADAKKPMLDIEHSTVKQVLVGETVRFGIVVTNPGSGTATDVTIEEDVPEGLSHSKGPELKYPIGNIPSGGQRRLELSLKAAKPGMVRNIIRARGSNGLVAEHEVQVEVIAPQLQVAIEGPSMRYLERQATYTVRVENGGTAAAQNVDLVLQLPRGLKFVGTENNGRYDSGTHTVRWLLQKLPAREFAPVKVTLNPMQKGDYNLSAKATADRGLKDSTDHPLAVKGIAALLFEVADQVDPISVGSVTTYSIQVTNQGTEDASNVQFVALVPPGMSAMDPSGTSRYQLRGNQIIFEPIGRLPAKEKSSYIVQVKGVQAGDQRFKVQMTSGETQSPVVEEESTRVYSDQ